MRQLMAQSDLPTGQVNLNTWLLSDNHEAQQDFHIGAKDAYSLPSVGGGSASPLMITNEDIPGWLETVGYNHDDYTNFDSGLYFDEKDYRQEKSQNCDKDTRSDDFQASFSSQNFLSQKELIFEEEKSRTTSGIFNSTIKDLTYDSIYDNVDVEAENGSATLEMQDYILPDSPGSIIDSILTDSPVAILDSIIPDSPGSLLDSFMPDSPASVIDSVNDGFLNLCNETKQNCEVIFKDENINEIPSQSKQIIPVPISEAFDNPKFPQALQKKKPIIKIIGIEDLKKEQFPAKQEEVIYCKRLAYPIQLTTPCLKDVISSEGDHLIEQLLPQTSNTIDIKLEEREVIEPRMEIMNCNISKDFEPNITTKYHETARAKAKQRKVPYTLTERKLRKKEQNKRAATRYRQKKKEEDESMDSGLKFEENRNVVLKEEFKTVKAELQLLKKLAREILNQRKVVN